MKDEEIIREAQRRYVPGKRSALFVEGAKWALGQEKKVIDLSKVAGQPIPMLFSFFGEGWIPGTLEAVEHDKFIRRHIIPKDKADPTPFCKFDLEAHPVAWFGGDCPLPEGVRSDYWLRTGEKLSWLPRFLIWQHHSRDDDIIAFKVTGLQEGYVYPWEV